MISVSQDPGIISFIADDTFKSSPVPFPHPYLGSVPRYVGTHGLFPNKSLLIVIAEVSSIYFNIRLFALDRKHLCTCCKCESSIQQHPGLSLLTLKALNPVQNIGTRPGRALCPTYFKFLSPPRPVHFSAFKFLKTPQARSQSTTGMALITGPEAHTLNVCKDLGP